MPVVHLSDLNTDGTTFGQSTTDKAAFYGSTPIVQRSLAAQATSLLSSSATFSAAHTAALMEVMNTLIALGIWKGA